MQLGIIYEVLQHKIDVYLNRIPDMEIIKIKSRLIKEALQNAIVKLKRRIQEQFLYRMITFLEYIFVIYFLRVCAL